MAKEKGSRGRKAGAAPAMPDSQAKALEAVKFEKIIETGRERKKNEALATQIFGKDRRKSAPVGPGKAGGLGGSLASRVGVQKVCLNTLVYKWVVVSWRRRRKRSDPRNVV